MQNNHRYLPLTQPKKIAWAATNPTQRDMINKKSIAYVQIFASSTAGFAIIAQDVYTKCIYEWRIS